MQGCTDYYLSMFPPFFSVGGWEGVLFSAMVILGLWHYEWKHVLWIYVIGQSLYAEFYEHCIRHGGVGRGAVYPV